METPSSLDHVQQRDTALLAQLRAAEDRHLVASVVQQRPATILRPDHAAAPTGS
jgi:hypothetical protein